MDLDDLLDDPAQFGEQEQEIIQQLEREERQKLDSQTVENPDESDDDTQSESP